MPTDVYLVDGSMVTIEMDFSELNNRLSKGASVITSALDSDSTEVSIPLSAVLKATDHQPREPFVA